MRAGAAVLALAALAAPAAALDLRPPGAAELVLDEEEAPAAHALATGPWRAGALPSRTLEGAVRRRVWTVEGAGLTTLGLLRPLREQLEAAGLAVLFDCADKACGGFDFRLGIEVLPGPTMFVDLGDFRYLSAEGPAIGLSLLVSRSPGLGFVQLVEVAREAGAAAAIDPADPADPAPGDPAADAAAAAAAAATGGLGALGAPGGLVAPGAPDGAGATADPAALGRLLAAEGRAVLAGLVFPSGSAELGAANPPGLSALAAWLNADRARRVALVGHTDAQGSFEANLALSRQRAEAVAARLAAAYGVDAGQIEARGVGYLAPLATNLTPEGRARNRRVEAVLIEPR